MNEQRRAPQLGDYSRPQAGVRIPETMGDKSPKNIHKQEEVRHEKTEEKVHHKHENAEKQHHHASGHPAGPDGEVVEDTGVIEGEKPAEK